MATEFNYTREWTDAEAFPLLSFTKNWENPEDYPTVETDEQKVRQDMQSLHDEVKNFLNEELIPRVILEDATVESWTASEAARVANEQARVTAESDRATAESNRASAENARAGAENARAAAESARATAETGRASAEQSRVSVEAGRVTAEQNRASAESARATAEAGRASAENARADAESERVTAEAGRSAAEAIRVENENQRIAAETSRVGAENARVTEFGTLKTESQNATNAANAASVAVNKMTVDHTELPSGSPVSVEMGQNAQGGIHLHFGLSRGTSGVYIGSGAMPPDCNVQVNPEGDPTDTGGLMMTTIYDTQGKNQDIFKYVDNKVGGIVIPDVAGQISNHNANTAAHGDIRTLVNTAQTTANNAATAAQTAQNSASAAQTTANNAKSAADAAQTAATNAQNTANSKAPMYTYGTADIEAGSASTAATGTLHFVYE